MGNPDGLNYAQNLRLTPPVESKQWLKNKTNNEFTRLMEWNKNLDKESLENSTCFGTHINRNFAYHWQGVLTNLHLCNFIELLMFFL